MSIPISKPLKFTIYLAQPKDTRKPLNMIPENEPSIAESENNEPIELFELECGIDGTLLIEPKVVVVCSKGIEIIEKNPEDFLTSDLTLNDSQVAIIHTESAPNKTYKFVSRQFSLLDEQKERYFPPRVILFKPLNTDENFINSLMQTARYSRFIRQGFLEVATNEQTLVSKLSALLPLQDGSEERIIPLTPIT